MENSRLSTKRKWQDDVLRMAQVAVKFATSRFFLSALKQKGIV
jgi:hypothetical protein